MTMLNQKVGEQMQQILYYSEIKDPAIDRVFELFLTTLVFGSSKVMKKELGCRGSSLYFSTYFYTIAF